MSVPALPCTTLSTTPTGLCLNLPGGSAVCLSYPSAGLPSAIAGTKMLLSQANVALAPLLPFFRVIDCIDKAKDILWAPDDFFTALLNLAGMVPALTVRVMIADALDILITYLQGTYSQLGAFVLQEAAILAASTKASTLGCAPLALTVSCATGQMTAQMQGLSDGVAPLNALVSTINILLGLVPGAPTIPAFSDLGSDPAAALAPLAATISALQVIRALPFFP